MVDEGGEIRARAERTDAQVVAAGGLVARLARWRRDDAASLLAFPHGDLCLRIFDILSRRR